MKRLLPRLSRRQSIDWPWAHRCGNGANALHEPVSLTCLPRTGKAKYPRGPHISEDDGLFGKKRTDNINHNQTITAITQQENWSNFYMVVRKEQRYKHPEPRQDRTHMSERTFVLVMMGFKQQTPHILLEKVPSLKLQREQRSEDEPEQRSRGEPAPLAGERTGMGGGITEKVHSGELREK